MIRKATIQISYEFTNCWLHLFREWVRKICCGKSKWTNWTIYIKYDNQKKTIIRWPNMKWANYSWCQLILRKYSTQDNLLIIQPTYVRLEFAVLGPSTCGILQNSAASRRTHPPCQRARRYTDSWRQRHELRESMWYHDYAEYGHNQSGRVLVKCDQEQS